MSTVTVENFRIIRSFVLKQGHRQTYCNMFNRNPHHAFSDFDVFLNPDVGQRNINCEPALSGFDALVIRDWKTEAIYYDVREDAEQGRLIVQSGTEAEIEKYFEAMLQVIGVQSP